MRELLLDQLRRYPLLTPQDACKALAQAVLGPEHFVSDYASALERIQLELAEAGARSAATSPPAASASAASPTPPCAPSDTDRSPDGAQREAQARACTVARSAATELDPVAVPEKSARTALDFSTAAPPFCSLDHPGCGARRALSLPLRACRPLPNEQPRFICRRQRGSARPQAAALRTTSGKRCGACDVRMQASSIANVPGATSLDTAPTFIEPLGDRFVRAHLGALERAGIAPETLARLFVLSSRVAPGDRSELDSGAAFLRALAESGAMPFSLADARAYLDRWIADGCPPVSHTDAFRAAYSPHYRVISRDFVEFLPLLSRIEAEMAARERVIVAIDGPCGSGKTTVAALLAEIYAAPVFAMDDYFLRPEQRTPERFAEPGGNVDRERFLAEVLEPLSRGAQTVEMSRFDCSTQALCPPERITVGRLAIVEGSYSMHPALAGRHTIKVLLDIDPDEQLRRIAARDPDLLDRFKNEWIPLENRYFDATDTASRADLHLDAPSIKWRKK